MKLWVLRHGEAELHAPRDALRALTVRGIEQVRQSAARLSGVPLAGILASPYVRAQQTAHGVQQALGGNLALRTVPWLTPENDPGAVSDQLAALATGDWLLVSHQPLVGSLLGWLERGERLAVHPMGTASLAELEGDGAYAGLMHLRSLYHPH